MIKLIGFIEPVIKTFGRFHFDWIGGCLGVVPNVEVAALTLIQRGGWLFRMDVHSGFPAKSNYVELIMRVSLNVYYKMMI